MAGSHSCRSCSCSAQRRSTISCLQNNRIFLLPVSFIWVEHWKPTSYTFTPQVVRERGALHQTTKFCCRKRPLWDGSCTSLTRPVITCNRLEIWRKLRPWTGLLPGVQTNIYLAQNIIKSLSNYQDRLLPKFKSIPAVWWIIIVFFSVS